MKRIISIGAIALLAAACGGSDKDAVIGDATDETSASVENSAGDDSTAGPAEGSDDTISVDDFSDMPPKCIELLATFLKQIEPTVSGIDLKTTMGEFQALAQQIETDSDSFDSQSAAAGCDKYNLTGSDEKQFQQMAELAAAEAPGTLGYIAFLGSLTASQTATAGSLPTDCASTIAAIEPFLAKGSFNDLTVDEVGVVQQLMGVVSTNCTTDEATAFFGRDDVAAFTS